MKIVIPPHTNFYFIILTLLAFFNSELIDKIPLLLIKANPSTYALSMSLHLFSLSQRICL